MTAPLSKGLTTDAVASNPSWPYPQNGAMVPITMPEPSVPSFDDWHKLMFGGTFAEIECMEGVHYQSIFVAMMKRSAEYLTFAARWRAAS